MAQRQAQHLISGDIIYILGDQLDPPKQVHGAPLLAIVLEYRVEQVLWCRLHLHLISTEEQVTTILLRPHQNLAYKEEADKIASE